MSSGPTLEFYPDDDNMNLSYWDYMHGRDVCLCVKPDGTVHERINNGDGTEDEDGNTLTLPTEHLEPRNLFEVLKAIYERD